MMNFNEYADVRLGMEARLRETYEEEFQEQAALDQERAELVALLRKNFEKFNELHRKKEQVRKGLRDSIANLEADYNRKEEQHG